MNAEIAGAELPAQISEPETITRFDRNQRLQHVILITSMVALGLTGLAQSFYRVGWAQGLLSLLGGLDGARLIHHTFAVVLAFTFFYHVITALLELLLGGSRSMLPRFKDVRDAVQSVKFMLGRAGHEPQYDRFDFRQKLEYWALIWGTVLMGLTGFILMFPQTFTRFLPGEVVYAAKAAHGLEALLAVFSIIIWHMYNTHLASGIFPLDRTIFTGKISRQRLQREHPLEYQRLESLLEPPQLEQTPTVQESPAGEALVQ